MAEGVLEAAAGVIGLAFQVAEAEGAMAIGFDPLDQGLEGFASAAAERWVLAGQGAKQQPHKPQQQVIEPQALGQGAAC
ncbi:MAG: hypothetical protein ACK5QQ_01530 [Cyanobacteriota bacterium]